MGNYRPNEEEESSMTRLCSVKWKHQRPNLSEASTVSCIVFYGNEALSFNCLPSWRAQALFGASASPVPDAALPSGMAGRGAIQRERLEIGVELKSKSE